LKIQIRGEWREEINDVLRLRALGPQPNTQFRTATAASAMKFPVGPGGSGDGGSAGRAYDTPTLWLCRKNKKEKKKKTASCNRSRRTFHLDVAVGQLSFKVDQTTAVALQLFSRYRPIQSPLAPALLYKHQIVFLSDNILAKLS